MKKGKKFKVICLACDNEAIVRMDNDGGCGDPECCGGREEWAEFYCKNCNIIEKI